MRKAVKTISVLLVALMCVCFFVACGKKEPTMKGVLTYDMVYVLPYMTGTNGGGVYEHDETLEKVWAEEGIQIYSLVYRPNLTIKSVKDLPQDKIVYTTEDRSAVKNGVVVNKWMYYYSLMVAKGEQVDPMNEKYAVANEALENDSFTMEKAALNKWCQCVWDAAEFIETGGVFQRRGKVEKYKENLPPYENKIKESLEKLCLTRGYRYFNENAEILIYVPCSSESMIVENALCYEYAVDRSQLKVAAMQRYGYIDVNQMERGIGKLKVWYDTDAPQTDEKNVLLLKEIPVIGYYESEADKLMSTGVPRDVRSDAYKLVFEQLYTPTFYLA